MLYHLAVIPIRVMTLTSLSLHLGLPRSGRHAFRHMSIAYLLSFYISAHILFEIEKKEGCCYCVIPLCTIHLRLAPEAHAVQIIVRISAKIHRVLPSLSVACPLQW